MSEPKLDDKREEIEIPRRIASLLLSRVSS
jgi:hypothetical protein